MLQSIYIKFWFIFLLFLPGILEALALEGMMQPVQGMMNEVIGFLPNLFTAGVTLAVGWLIARIVQRIVTSFAAAAGLDTVSERFGLQTALGGQKLSAILGTVVNVFILIPILISALSALHLDAVTEEIRGMAKIDPKRVDAYLNGKDNSFGSTGWTCGCAICSTSGATSACCIC